jgi:hypothetical protein
LAQADADWELIFVCMGNGRLPSLHLHPKNPFDETAVPTFVAADDGL